VSAPDAASPAIPSLAAVFLRPFMKLAAVQPGERVLDIAPGDGEVAVEAALRAGELGEVLAVDPRPERLEAVGASALAAGVTHLRTARMDPARLDLPDAYWDVVVCHLGVQEFADPEQAIAETRRVLRPVGRLAISALGERERCPLVTFFLDAVGARVPAVKAEAQYLFRYAQPGSLARLLAEQGYEDATPERVTEWVPFPTVDDYWAAMTAAPFGRHAAALSADDIAACKTEIERKMRFYRRGAGYELKVEAIILAAVK
jgi:ubiquinone/menaquinone biosynthesis C-methylase UbiE